MTDLLDGTGPYGGYADELVRSIFEKPTPVPMPVMPRDPNAPTPVPMPVMPRDPNAPTPVPMPVMGNPLLDLLVQMQSRNKKGFLQGLLGGGPMPMPPGASDQSGMGPLHSVLAQAMRGAK